MNALMRRGYRLLRRLRARRHRRRMARLYRSSSRGPDTVVIVLTIGRTGSNLLVSYLDSQPGVSLRGEVLNPATWEGLSATSKQASIEHVRHSIATSGPIVGGAKLLMYQLREHDLTFDDFAEIVPNAKILVLFRESLLEQHVSLLRAHADREWSRTTSSKEGGASLRVDFDVEGFERHVDQVRGAYRRMAASLWVRERAAIVRYESLAADPDSVFRDVVGPHLGLDVVPVVTDLRKQNRRDVRESIRNLTDVAETIERAMTDLRYRVTSAEMAELFNVG